MNHKHLIAMAIAAMISTPVMAQSAPQADPAAAKQAAPAANKAEDKPASNAQILRDKIKADKKLVVAKNMNLTESEAKTFWPLYDAYQKDLDALNKRTGKMIKSYADAFNNKKMNDDIAKGLTKEALDIQEAETNLMRTYAAKMEMVIPATKVMRYLQIENKIRAFIKYELADEIPLAP